MIMNNPTRITDKEDLKALIYCKCKGDIIPHRFLNKYWEIGVDRYVCLLCKRVKTLSTKKLLGNRRNVSEVTADDY